ncbi:MAG: response regulator transcription factor [Alphaproteobacteria bacterium]|nr:response regulator transcription factor [Alphaproteobacteria bacterium]MDE2495128.1 response regulator transcription factor [Alphaproteobacteria bacterium]
MKVLIVEDHRRLGRFLKQSLTENHYTVAWATSCAEARDLLAEMNFDLVVLDIGLPDGGGLTLLREWRLNKFNEPVLILSARDTVQDRITGLDLGADDYLPKPFSLEELLAHIRALLRRQSSVKLSIVEHGGVRLDLLSHTVHCNDKPVDLTSREFALLEVFMQSPGRVLTRTYIAEKVWPSNYDIDTNLLDVYMSRLRNKLECAQGKSLFKTVRGVGYQLI